MPPCLTYCIDPKYRSRGLQVATMRAIMTSSDTSYVQSSKQNQVMKSDLKNNNSTVQQLFKTQNLSKYNNHKFIILYIILEFLFLLFYWSGISETTGQKINLKRCGVKTCADICRNRNQEASQHNREATPGYTTNFKSQLGIF